MEGARNVLERTWSLTNDSQLTAICKQKYAVGGKRATQCPTKKVAEQCRVFIQDRPATLDKPTSTRLVHLLICPDQDLVDRESIAGTCADLHIILFPGDSFSVAKQSWQHTGMGISSCLADKCLALLLEELKEPRVVPATPTAAANRYSKGGFTKHYSVAVKKTPSPPPTATAEDVCNDTTVYLEERYGCNLPLTAASFAKRALRRRLAGILLCDRVPECRETAGQELKVGPSTRGVKDVSETDIFMYPMGMSAI
ncbi:hypothetical protein H1R20_g4035, partial [Candolleomyces eurysporus]